MKWLSLAMNERDIRDGRVKRARTRALAMGPSNVVLIVVMFFSLRFGYDEYDSGFFFLLEGCVLLACILLNVDPYARLLIGASTAVGDDGEDQDEEVDTSTPQQPTPRSYLVLSRRPAEFMLGLTILTNFAAVGQLINGTGGITASPFGAYAFTMVILGMVMARLRSMVGILAFGIAFFFVLAYSRILGDSMPERWTENEYIRDQFVAVMVVNLVISWGVTWLSRKRLRG